LWILSQPDWEWLVSPEIIQEYRQVLQRPKFAFSPATLSKWETLLQRDTQLISVDEQVDFPRDQKDAKFLACAITADADYLITSLLTLAKPVNWSTPPFFLSPCSNVG